MPVRSPPRSSASRDPPAFLRDDRPQNRKARCQDHRKAEPQSFPSSRNRIGAAPCRSRPSPALRRSRHDRRAASWAKFRCLGHHAAPPRVESRAATMAAVSLASAAVRSSTCAAACSCTSFNGCLMRLSRGPSQHHGPGPPRPNSAIRRELPNSSLCIFAPLTRDRPEGIISSSSTNLYLRGTVDLPRNSTTLSLMTAPPSPPRLRSPSPWSSAVDNAGPRDQSYLCGATGCRRPRSRSQSAALR